MTYAVRPAGHQIMREVCELAGVTRGELLGPWRTYHVSSVRQIIAWRMRRETLLSYTQIARLLDRDHTTIIYLERRCASRMRGQLDWRSLIERVE